MFLLRNLPTAVKGKYAASFRDFLTKLKMNSYKYFNEIILEKVFSPIFKEGNFKQLSDFSLNNSIIVNIPDKGRGVVILDKDTCLVIVSRILSYISKFKVIADPIRIYYTQLENKFIRYFEKLKQTNGYDEITYTQL